MGRRTVIRTLLGAALAAHYLPSVGTIPALHRGPLHRLAGGSPLPHVALTFDDGPDTASTPSFLDLLDELDVQATFFLLGARVAEDPGTARALVDRGHDVAVHAWTHRPHLLRTPWAVERDVTRTATEIRRVTDCAPRFWRPPNGVLSGAGLAAAHARGLQPVLWTADGQDWAASATPASVAHRIVGRLDAGGTVLLHDSDVTSAPGSWRAALGAVPEVVTYCRTQGWAVGPLRDHWG